MKRFVVLVLVCIAFCSCDSNSRSSNNSGVVKSSDPFCGVWVQVADLYEQEIPKNEVPMQIRISKANVPEYLKAAEGDIFYLVECLNSDRQFEPYPDRQGVYYKQGDYLISRAFGSKFSIKIGKDSNYFYENAWYGHFKKNH